ncbi:MAG: TIGR03905 family TSCPD domain-containing protein, partial [Mogibacterium sp.]|nr:TIGR03905 family TSCPD domain-containing protein [Mogibacterium sp.]
MALYSFRPQGVCSQMINLDVEDGIVKEVEFLGGCNGNLSGISSLVKGMKVDDVIARLEG